MTPFQISLNHVFILSVLLDCKPTEEFHCSAVVMLTLANSQFKFVAFIFTASRPCTFTKHFESVSSFVTAVEILFLASLIVFYLKRQVKRLHQTS